MLSYLIFASLSVLTSNVAYVIAISFPVTKTWKAISADEQEQRRWLRFWTVFSLLYVMECLTFNLLLRWVWLYQELRLLFILWLSLPTYDGASVLYGAIAKVLLHFEKQCRCRFCKHFSFAS